MQKSIIKLFWQSAIKYPFRTWSAIITSGTAAITVGFIAPLIIAKFLEQLQAGSLNLTNSLPLLGAFILIQVYGEIIGWRLTLYFHWTMEVKAMRDLYARIFKTLTEQSLTFHSNRFGGALVSQTTKLIGAFEKFWDTVNFQFVPAVASIVAAIAILSFVFWQYAIVLTILVIVFILCVTFGSRFILPLNKADAQANTAVHAYVADAVTNVATIKSHGHENNELQKLKDKAAHWGNKSLANMWGFLYVSTAYSTLMAVLNIAALVAAVWAAEHHLISIGAVYISIVYTLNVARQLWEMNAIMRNYNKLMGDAFDMAKILQTPLEVTDHSSDKLIVTKGTIAFNDVSFTHDGNNDALFHNFSITIPAGQRVGLVGHSGSGKTTLTRILLRFSDVDSGTISIDGTTIIEVSQESLRKAIAYVPQEPMLFHRTLSENIAYGKPGASAEEIRRAAKQANALDFVESLPAGFDTLVGERGVKLSGGQRQRIAIARAILKDAPILVLDEATSALDSESEKLIQEALEKLMKNRTSIVIAHRLSTIAKLDRIVVLEDGKIIEDGSHAELLQQKGVYAKLWSHQSGGFIEE